MDRSYIKARAAERKEPLGDVARKLGIGQPWLSAVIAGANITPDLAKKIAEWHGKIDAGFVLWGDE